MEGDRWQQLSQIFEAALAVPPEDRDALLADRCGTDDALLRDVQSLIESHQKASAENFIGMPAAQRAAPLLTDEVGQSQSSIQRLQPGDQISHYEVKQLLGTGGMGEVYLATDTRLDRAVALKILPEEVAADQRRMLRFKQEARAVSALNQPNILTIYEFGETENLHFLASEFIDGETLRRKFASGRLKLGEMLDIAIQVCAALEAAHEANIVHRDIKPENIMIRRRDSVVKVLDFGLAKLSDKTSTIGQVTDTEAATEVLVRTVPGSIMGTFNYMSPEQTQGLHVDHRSDIWSVGVVVYEMITGRSPFAGPTPSHTVVSILEKHPEPLSKFVKTPVPSELQRIVGKTLEKDPKERYQSASDLLIDLKNLRKQVNVEAEIRRSDPSAKKQGGLLDAQPAIGTSTRRRFFGRVLPIVLVIAVLVLGIVVAFYLLRPPSTPPPGMVPIAQHELNYSITVQKYREGKPFEEPFNLSREINFERDYRIRLNVRSPEAGYLYVLNETPDPGEPLSILFPSPKTNSGSAFLTENTVITIPETSWFSLDSDRGSEKIWLVWSTSTIPALEPLRGFANSEDKGVVTDANLNQQALMFIRSNADSQTTAVKDEQNKQTVIRTDKTVLLHLLTLEHH